MQGQQTYTGTAGQTALAATLRPPQKQSILVPSVISGMCLAFVIGFFTEGMVFRAPAILLAFIMPWIIFSMQTKASYENELKAWKDYLERHFICLRCGEIFEPRPT